MPYTNEAKVKEYLGISTLPSPLTAITNFLAYVTAYINNYCGRSFESEAVASKLYDGNGTNTVLTDDFTAISKIEILDDDGNVDFTIDADTEYYTYPENTTVKNKIIINTYNAPITYFPTGHKNVKVYATFGFSASVPDEIAYVATVLIANMIQENYSSTDDVKAESLGEYSVTYGDVDKSASTMPEVKTILDRYRRIQFSGV